MPFKTGKASALSPPFDRSFGIYPTTPGQHLDAVAPRIPFKGYTSRMLRQECAQLRSRLPTLWSRGPARLQKRGDTPGTGNRGPKSYSIVRAIIAPLLRLSLGSNLQPTSAADR
jgi:hypothetical protein